MEDLTLRILAENADPDCFWSERRAASVVVVGFSLGQLFGRASAVFAATW